MDILVYFKLYRYNGVLSYIEYIDKCYLICGFEVLGRNIFVRCVLLKLKFIKDCCEKLKF